jgi:lipopolysaccharide export system protein LptA
MRGGLGAWLGAALAILLGMAAPCWAQSKSPAPGGALGLTGQDNGKPIRIEADNGIEWQQAKRIYIARGNATATRGQTSVRADTLYAYYRSAARAGRARDRLDPGLSHRGGRTRHVRNADANRLWRSRDL